MKNRDITFILRMRNLSKAALSKLRGDFRRVSTTAAQASKNVRGVDKNVLNLGKTVTNTRRIVGGLARGLAALGVGIGLGAAVRVLADFSQEMSTVRAITQATEEQFGALRDTAKDLGIRTRFSATQAAEGMSFLARAGFDANEVVEAIGGTLQLAQAGALDLGSAADIASNVLQGFALETKQTGRVVDVLAFAAANSNTTVLQLGEALKTVAPIATSLGISLEETVAAVGTLSNAGIQSTLAATGLNTILSRLERQAPPVAKALRRLGIDGDSVRPSIVGLSGAMRTLAEAGITTTEAFELFEKRGAPSFFVLQKAIPDLQNFTGELDRATGTAQRIATVMDENLNGALLRVRSAFQGLIIEFGEAGAETGLTQFFDGLAAALRFAAENADVLGRAIVILTILLIGRFRGAIVAAIVNLTGFTGAMTGATVATRLFAVALKAVGIGLIIAALNKGIEVFGQLRTEVADGVTGFNLFQEAVSVVTKRILQQFALVGRSAAAFGRAISKALTLDFGEARAAAREAVNIFNEALEGDIFKGAGTEAANNIANEIIANRKIRAAFVRTGKLLQGEFTKRAKQAGVDGATELVNAFEAGIGDFGGFDAFKQSLNSLVKEFVPAIAKQREQAEALRILDLAALASAEELEKLGLTQAQLAQVTAAAKKSFDAETSSIGKAIVAAKERVRLLQFETGERKIQAALSAARTAALEAEGVVDGKKIADLEEQLRLEAAITEEQDRVTKAKAFNKEFQETIRGIGQEIELLGLNEDQRRRILAIQQLQNQAAAAGVSDISKQVAELDAALADLGAREDIINADAFAGARAGLDSFIAGAKDLNSQFENFANRTLQDLSDGLTEFVTTGKFDFNDFVNNALQGLQRIASARIVAGIGGALFGAPATGGPAGGGGGGLIGAGLSLLQGLFMHGGGVVGKGGGSPILAPALAFKDAKRFHEGGRVGGSIGFNEVPIIARRGETVLTEEQSGGLLRALQAGGVGGVGQADMIGQPFGGGAGDARDAQNNVTVVLNVMTPNPDAFRRNLGKIGAQAGSEINRNLRRNG